MPLVILVFSSIGWNMAKSPFKIWLLICLLFVSQEQAYGEALSASATVKSSNETILALYRSSPKTDDKVLREIFAVMDRVTDYQAMAASALQQVCPGKDETLCAQIRSEFIETLKLSATVKLGRYRADRFDYGAEEQRGKKALVKTIAYYKEDSVQLEYILEKRDGTWRIVNYLVDEVDTIRNYQRQFKRIIEKESLAGLLARLQKKNEQYRQERRE